MISMPCDFPEVGIAIFVLVLIELTLMWLWSYTRSEFALLAIYKLITLNRHCHTHPNTISSMSMANISSVVIHWLNHLLRENKECRSFTTVYIGNKLPFRQLWQLRATTRRTSEARIITLKISTSGVIDHHHRRSCWCFYLFIQIANK